MCCITNLWLPLHWRSFFYKDIIVIWTQFSFSFGHSRIIYAESPLKGQWWINMAPRDPPGEEMDRSGGLLFSYASHPITSLTDVEDPRLHIGVCWCLRFHFKFICYTDHNPCRSWVCNSCDPSMNLGKKGIQSCLWDCFERHGDPLNMFKVLIFSLFYRASNMAN